MVEKRMQNVFFLSFTKTLDTPNVYGPRVNLNLGVRLRLQNMDTMSEVKENGVIAIHIALLVRNQVIQLLLAFNHMVIISFLQFQNETYYNSYMTNIFVLDKDVSEEIPEEELNEIEDQNDSTNTENQG